MSKAEEIRRLIINETLGCDYKTIYIGHAVEVLNKQFVYKQDIERLKTKIAEKMEEYAFRINLYIINEVSRGLAQKAWNSHIHYPFEEDFDNWLKKQEEQP